MKLDESLASDQGNLRLFWRDLTRNPEFLAHPWSVCEMARRCGMGVTRFTDQCKRLTNMTPIDYLNHCRVEAAARLLLDKPRLKITDVGLTCGFSSSQYFAKVFRQIKGCSPKDFRRRTLHNEGI